MRAPGFVDMRGSAEARSRWPSHLSCVGRRHSVWQVSSPLLHSAVQVDGVAYVASKEVGLLCREETEKIWRRAIAPAAVRGSSSLDIRS